MSEFRRVVSYGTSAFKLSDGAAWIHRCGTITAVDLLDDFYGRQPWERECGGCRGRDEAGWRPLFAFDGPLCDQCRGNGWVPISGHVTGAPCGYDTVTECTACATSGVAR